VAPPTQVFENRLCSNAVTLPAKYAARRAETLQMAHCKWQKHWPVNQIRLLRLTAREPLQILHSLKAVTAARQPRK